MGPFGEKSDFLQSLSLPHFTCTSSQMSSQVECGPLFMVGTHPGLLGNWAFKMTALEPPSTDA